MLCKKHYFLTRHRMEDVAAYSGPPLQGRAPWRASMEAYIAMAGHALVCYASLQY